MSLVKPNRPVFADLAALAAMVGGGDVLGVGGHHFARLPLALLRAVAARGLTGLRYTAWAGGLPLELLLEAEAVVSIDICFSSLDIFGLPPRFRAVAEAGSVPVRDWTALGMIQALRAAQQNQPSLPFQLPEGSDMMARMPGARIVADPLAGRPVGAIGPLRLNTLLLHAPRADASGNVQIIGARALDLAMAGAARQVLVTVEEIVPVGALPQAGRQTVLLRNQVSAIALAPGGAYPASCLPFYATDYACLAAAFADGAGALAARLAVPQAGVPGHLRVAAALPPVAALPLPAIHAAPDPPSIAETMIARIAAELDDGSVASAGAVSPLANIAYRLAKATHAPGMILASLSCGHLDIAPSPMLLSALETWDAATAAAHAGGDDTYSALYQAGAVTHEIVAVAQVDRRGRVNNLSLTRPSGGRIRLPGQGGMASRRQHAPRLRAVCHPPLAAVGDGRGGHRQLRARFADGGRARGAWLPHRPRPGVHRSVRVPARPGQPRVGCNRVDAGCNPRGGCRCNRVCRDFRPRLHPGCTAVPRHIGNTAASHRPAWPAANRIRRRARTRGADR